MAVGQTIRCHGIAQDDPSFRRIVTFHYRCRTGGNVLGLQMDSQSRAFEAPVEASWFGAPLRCPWVMVAQPLVPWTPGRIFVALFTALISAQGQLAPAATNRRRA
jgi:hypothetical protein